MTMSADPRLDFVPAPIPAHDRERVAALHDLGVLDTAPEPRFDRYVEMMQAIFEVPIAVISLIDLDRQWFKAKVGVDTCSTGRQESFCGQPVAEDSSLVVYDTLEDERFARNPLVLGEPFIRFYAGAVLRAPGGEAVGTACVIDTKPRLFGTLELQKLEGVAEFIESELHSPVI